MIFYIWLLFAMEIIGGVGIGQGRRLPPPPSRFPRPIRKKYKKKQG